MQKAAPPLPAEGLPTETVLRKIRIPCIQRATLGIAGAREDLFMIDLGLRGVFIERSRPVATGEEIEIWFALPGNEIRIHARCRVAWVRPRVVTSGARTLPAGIGVEFVALSDHDAERVRQHLLEYLRRHPRQRRFLRHPEEVEEEA
jgi:Tfp pilus assembly protein PilZ